MKIFSFFFAALVIAGATLTVYWQVHEYSFVSYDDPKYVIENDRVQNGLTAKNAEWALTAVVAANWHPLTLLSHMTDCQIYGLNSGSHHLTNLIIHILNSLLLFIIFRWMTTDLWKSFFLSALFALHPLHVESVAWISERKDVLNTFFWFLTIISYIKYCERPGAIRFIPVFLFYFLGLMSKPMIVTLPFVLLLLDFWPLGRMKIFARKDDDQISNSSILIKPLLSEKIPLFLLSGAASVVTLFAQSSQNAVASLKTFPLYIRIANAFISYVNYCINLIWPFDLSVLYPHPEKFMFLEAASAFTLIAAISFVVFRFAGRKPYLAVGWFWYIGTLVPVIGLVQVGAQAMADRYTYVPLVGIFIIMAWGISDILADWKYKAFGMRIMAVTFLLILAGITWQQIAYWKDSKTLFSHALEVTENNAIAHNNLGSVFGKKGQLRKAREHYTKAIQLNSNYVSAIHNLGLVFFRMGNLNEAIDQYTEALRIDPGYEKAHYDMAVALQKKGRRGEAGRHYSEALKIDPEYAEAHINLGIILAENQKLTEAANHFIAALKIKNDMPRAYFNLGNILFTIDKTDMAIAHYRKALEINPNYEAAYMGLGNAFVKKGDIMKAINSFEKVLKMDPNNIEAKNNHRKLLNLKLP